MPSIEPASWSELLEPTLERYDEPLLRQVSDQLFKPRSHWPVEELVARCLATLNNATVLRRRVQGLEPSGRKLLALFGQSRQPRWRVGSLVEMLAVLEGNADLRPVLALLEAGLLYPVLPDQLTRLKGFEQWLGSGGLLEVFAPPPVTALLRGEDLEWPDCPGQTMVTGGVHESDGLEWLLRLAVVWQQVAAGPLRRAQTGEFFKRDLDRLRGDPLLNGPPPDQLAELPDAGLLAVELALLQGWIREISGEITAVPRPPSGEQTLSKALESFWAALPRLDTWNVGQGWQGQPTAGNPYLSAQLLALALLARLPAEGWAWPREVARWVVERHPYWTGPAKDQTDAPTDALACFLLGLAYSLRLLRAAKDAQGQWAVRLSPWGRWLLGVGEEPAAPEAFPQTLLVQPNLEIIAYRQGLTPTLIARLGQLAAWKSLGSACTLQLQPDTVYRALEAGQTFETLRQTLDQHGMKPTPPAVLESLRTWADKRERLGIYSSATLFEFASADDLNEALARGLPATRLSDRLAVVADESAIDFRHFRLTGTRDYGLPPDKCVSIGADGVTLSIDLAKSDLMLETELSRFAEPAARGDRNGHCQFRLTPASLAAARASGFHEQKLEEWFLQRTGQPPSPAARLLLNGDRAQPLTISHQLVLHVAEPAIADGLLQWPETRVLIQSRLGPTALVVAEEHIEELRRRVAVVGLSFR
jgi:hypothetical protein